MLKSRFIVTGYDAGGGRLQIESGATTADGAVRESQGRIVTVVRVEESRARSVRSLSLGQLGAELRGLHELIGSGLSLFRAVDALRKRSAAHAAVQIFWEDAVEALEQGQALSTAIARSAPSAPPFLLSALRTAEVTGALEDTLRRVCEAIEGREDMRRKLLASLGYPIFLLIFGVLAIGLVVVVVVPRFAWVLDSETPVPLLTRVVITAAMWINDQPLMVALVIVAVGAAAVALFRIRHHSAIPAMFPSIAARQQARGFIDLCDQLAVMLPAGVHLPDAISAIRQSAASHRERERLDAMLQALVEGKPLARTLQDQYALQPDTSAILESAEQSATLDTAFSRIAELQHEAESRRTQIILRLIEPLAIVLIGGIIGLVIVAIMMGITAATATFA